MNYEQRLVAAAKIVLSGDARQNELCVDARELGLKATLKPHQIEGVSWLIRRYIIGVNVVLGDEMGLGKTLQAISLLSYLKTQKISDGPFFVICPLSVLDGWSHEISNFAPKLKVLTYLGGKEHRRSLRRKLYEDVKRQYLLDASQVPFDVLLTTYDIALMDQDFLSQFPWQFSVIDEAQRLKNSSSVLYNVLINKYVMPRRLLMTGTPIQNNLTELWALMHFCMPSVFGALEQFLSTFKDAANYASGHGATKAREQLKTIKYILRAFMLRRTKSQLIESGNLILPLLTEITMMVPLVALQKKIYMSILRKELPHLIAFSTGTCSHQSLQNIVIQLRKVCSHPYMFPGIEPEPYEEGEHLVQASGKLIILDKLLHNLHNTGHRVLLFAQMTHTLDILQDFMELRGYSYERLDGSVRAEERFAAIRSFNRAFNEDSELSSDSGDAFVFLISTRAGGVGLNLVAADSVIFFEQDWNPQVDKQALQRAHRIGQANHILAINLVSERTIEEVIMRRAEKKLQLSYDIVGDDNQSMTELGGNGAESLRTVIFGLHIFEPSEVNEQPNDLDSLKLDDMVQNVTAMRDRDYLNQETRQFEINSESSLGPQNIMDSDSSIAHSEPAVDEVSYISWVNKFKEASKSIEGAVSDTGITRRLPREKHQNAEARRNKAEDKKLLKWEAHGYISLSIEAPATSNDYDTLPNSGVVNFVYGDCTYPAKVCPSEPTLIFSCVDDSGIWGHGGMFDALSRLSLSVIEAYGRASEFSDLHVGDVHLIDVTKNADNPRWAALAVVQSYNRRRKVPRSNLSLPDLETCLLKASFFAFQKSASIHMPRIGYRENSDRSEWYTVERLLRKYSSIYGIKIFVYYYCRS